MKHTAVVVPLFISLIFNIVVIVLATDDRFIRRYAYMKMYESCFGPEVVKEVRKEMKMATSKCNGITPSTYSSSSKKSSYVLHSNNKHQVDRTDNTYSSENLKSHASSGVDLNKLQQAILSAYNKHLALQTPYTNNFGVGQAFGYSHVRPWTGYSAPGHVHTFAPQMNGLLPAQPSSPGYVPTMNHPNNPFNQAGFFSPFYNIGRSSRDLDIKGQLETLAAKVSGRIRNVTCLMQELGYLNVNLEPDYEQIISRIKKLSISDELKAEIIDGVEYCKQFSLCVPDDSKDKFSKEMVKPMFFFRCYKHKKMEACILKDIKEKYSSDEVDDNIIGIDRTDRSIREFNNNDVTELALYEFLYGTDSMEIDEF